MAGASGSLRARHIPLEGMRNFRDVGGIAGLPRGVLYRSDDPILATEADKRRVRELGLRTVIDLRTDIEVERKGHHDFGTRRIECDLPPNAKVVARTTGVKIQQGYAKGPAGMAEANELLLDVGRESLAAAIRAIAAPGGTPALFHCSSGKDRTGLLAMLLLSFAGAADDDIVADYALTAELAPPPPDGLAKAKAQFTAFTGAELDDEGARNVLAAEPQSARLTLAMLRRVHGSAEAYFRSELRLGAAEVGALRAVLRPADTAAPPQRAVAAPGAPAAAGGGWELAVGAALGAAAYALLRRRAPAAERAGVGAASSPAPRAKL